LKTREWCVANVLAIDAFGRLALAAGAQVDHFVDVEKMVREGLGLEGIGQGAGVVPAAELACAPLPSTIILPAPARRSPSRDFGLTATPTVP
jgi:hypothetical protein